MIINYNTITMEKEQLKPSRPVAASTKRKPMTIDPRLQIILESLNDAKKQFNEVYNQIMSEGIGVYESAQKDFMTDLDSAISNTTYMAALKIEFDLRVLCANEKQDGGAL